MLQNGFAQLLKSCSAQNGSGFFAKWFWVGFKVYFCLILKVGFVWRFYKKVKTAICKILIVLFFCPKESRLAFNWDLKSLILNPSLKFFKNPSF